MREICGGLATALGKLVHLGLKKAPPRSTLSYANIHRPWELFETVFYDVLSRCQELASTKRRRFRFKNPLRSLDSTTIELCAEVFDWATFRRTKGAVKLHLQLDHRGCLPCWALVAEGAKHDVKAAQGLSFAPGTIVALDRGYNDYRLFGRWTEEGVFFVTRAKEGIQYEIVERRLVPENGDVIYDEVIRLTGKGAAERCPHLLRLITVVPRHDLDVWDALLPFSSSRSGSSLSAQWACSKTRNQSVGKYWRGSAMSAKSSSQAWGQTRTEPSDTCLMKWAALAYEQGLVPASWFIRRRGRRIRRAGRSRGSSRTPPRAAWCRRCPG